MKNLWKIMPVGLLAVLLTGCGMFGGGESETTYTASQLKGTWSEADNAKCYWVYTMERDSTGEYYWGKTWDEADDVFEADLEEHGNGWFKWKLEGKTLTQIHMMNISSAVVPKYYTITSLDANMLVMKQQQQTGTAGKALTFNKVK